MTLKITEVISPAPRAIWQALYQADPEAVPYQSPSWADSAHTICKAVDASHYYRLSNGHEFVMPLVSQRKYSSMVRTAGSMPGGWGMGGLLGTMLPTPEEIRVIFDHLLHLPFISLNIRPNPRLGNLWKAAIPAHARVLRIPRLAHVLDLAGGFDVVWEQRFSKKTRKFVRKAERSDITVESDSTGRLVPVFHDLLTHAFDQWATQQNEPKLLARLRGHTRDPLEKFHTITQLMRDSCRVSIAWIDGQPAASSLVLQHHNVNDSRAAMNRDLVAQTGANDLIQMLTIKDACESGCRFYHLGESGSNEGLTHFKSRFGAEAYAYEEYYIEKLPITRADRFLRSVVKKAIGFKD